MTGPTLRVGTVIRLFDGTVSPPKFKRWVCVEARQGWFLRINSRAHFRPNCPVYAADEPHCLDHDSFVELRGIIDYDLDDLAHAIVEREAEILGTLGERSTRRILATVSTCTTLTATEIEIVTTSLNAALPID